MNADSTPPADRDASERAFRTLLQGLAVDVLAGIGVALTAAVAGGIQWTQAYWIALALAVGKSAVTAVVSYFARKLVPPAGA
jgi:hypothetical protein